MIKCKVLLVALAVAGSVAAAPLPWFETNSPLTQAHRHLLNSNLPAMFTSFVEVLQLEKDQSMVMHLNDLFRQSLDIDCGKTLSNHALPPWISAMTVRRTEIQSTGRDDYQAVIEIESNRDIQSISLNQWLSKSISSDTSFIKEELQQDPANYKYTKRYNINSRIKSGLYRIIVTATDKSSWSSWLILGELKPQMTVVWDGKAHWKLEKHALLNPSCPLPRLDVTLYNYIDGDYNQVWRRSYDGDYPTYFDDDSVPKGRYGLAVSINHQRWQGPIIVERSQIISKTYDVSVEE